MDNTALQVLREAARATLLDYPLVGNDLEQAIAAIVDRASRTPSIMKKFYDYTEDSSAVSKGKGDVTIVSDVRHESSILPSMRLPSVMRKRCKEVKLRIDHRLSSETIELYNLHYGKMIKFNFTKTMAHDHPEAASSRKIETEVAMEMLRARGADLLRRPVNAYDTSVLDVGGDWRYHYVRHHEGVHVDAPFLDMRDRARDARKRLQLDEHIDSTIHVCRNKMQDCDITAPFMMAIHSVLYTTKIIEICESMAKRGTWFFVGTMQLPQSLATMTDRYVDPDYGYVIEHKSADIAMTAKYLPPHLRVGVGKYWFGASDNDVMYRYPSGESREYVHNKDILIEKLYDRDYYVNTVDGRQLTYTYKIVKRVGSLAYITIELQQDNTPVNKVPMVKPIESYIDGYAISIDANMLADFPIKLFRDTEVVVPRQLFTAVAAYCLTKVRDLEFSVESAITYGFSASSQYEANGVILNVGLNNNLDRNTVVFTASIAAYFWAYDRFRLIEHRLPQLVNLSAQYNAKAAESLISSFIDTKEIGNAIKSMFKRGAADLVTDYIITNTTTYADIKTLYDKLSSIATPGINSIRDLAVCYKALIPLTRLHKDNDKYYSSIIVRDYPVSYPLYELDASMSLQRIRSVYDLVRDGTEISEAMTLVDADVIPPIPPSLSDVTKIALDAITMTEASQAEKDQTALEIYNRSFDPNTRDVVDMEMLKGLVKGRPTLLYYANDAIYKIVTLELTYHRGTEEYETILQSLMGARCIYPERVDGLIKYGTCVIRQDGILVSDKKYRTSNQTFTALVVPDMRIKNAHRLFELRQLVMSNPIMSYPIATLANECAGSGKTHDQCVRYKNDYLSGRSAAIFASTKAAANQAQFRLTQWNVPIVEFSISTVDSFLMNKRAWKPYDCVYIDEALQLHAGKIICIALLTEAKVIRGYGDRKQIGYIPFTRFHRPSVNTQFNWSSEEVNLTTRRIPNDDMIVSWLKTDLYYGAAFNSISNRTQAVVLTARFASFEEKLSVKALYRMLHIPAYQELMILVYLQDEALRLRSKMSLTRTMPVVDEEQIDAEINHYRCCVCTIGESQGEDVDNVVVIRLSQKAEPLHADKSQTTVALTRHKKRWAYLAVQSQFKTAIEEFIPNINIYNNFESARADAKMIFG